MALTQFQTNVCRLIAAHRIASGESYVAGGVALNEALAGARLSDDVDLFHDTDQALDASWTADRASLLREGFDVVIEKKIKPGSGLGSSAASAAGVVVAVNELLGKPLTDKELLSLAMEGEAMASGSRHLDNVAPCILGGTVLIRDTSESDVVKLNNPDLFISIVHPQIEIKTSYAREILPIDIPLKKAVVQWANVGGLVGGICMNDLELISRSLIDVIVEPVRSRLIPGFDEVKRSALQAGAMGGGISGSGPSIFMFSKDEDTATKVASEMQSVFDRINIECKSYITRPSKKGVEVLNSK
jgi:homoserine kinase